MNVLYTLNLRPVSMGIDILNNSFQLTSFDIMVTLAFNELM